MMPMVMGAGYIGGGYFFVRAIVAARWHEITVGFLPVTTFASSMLLATLLHLDRFNQTSPAFWVWLIIYLTTPFLVFATWLRNGRTDPGVLGPGDVPIPSTVRAILGTAGALVLAVLENGLAAYTTVPTSLQDAVSFALLFVALVALPRGLPGLLSRFERRSATR